MTRSTLHNSLHDQNAENWVRLSKAQDQGSRHDTGRLHWSCDFSEWRSSEFWRLGTPRPAPKVTLKKNWQSPQQQQHSTSDTDVPSLWKQRTKREDQAGVQDITDHSTEPDFATRKLGHTTSKMDVDTHLSNKEVSTNALLKNEAVKDELIQNEYKSHWNCQKWVKQNLYSRRSGEGEDECLVKNPAKLFSRWVRWSSSNRKHPEIDANHVYTTFWKEQFFAHAASTSDPTKKWYDVSKQLFKFSKHPTSVRLWLLHKNGPNLWQDCHHKAKDALRVRKRAEENLRRSVIDGKMTTPTGSLNLPMIGRMRGWDTWTTLHKMIPLTKRRKNREVEITIYFIYEGLTKMDRHHLYRRGQGTKKQRTHWSRCKGNRI